MDRLLARLERRIGRYAIPNLILYVVGGMAIIWLLSFTRHEAIWRLTLDMDAIVARHEYWRLVTFLFVPLGSDYFALIGMYFTWWVGSSLEKDWGSFRFNVYYFLGALGTVVAALIAGHATNMWLDSSLLLAFATIFPDVTILLFFILPLRVKWLGLFAAAGIGVSFVLGGWATRASIAAALVNYVLFFSEYWVKAWRNRTTLVRQKGRREQLRPTAAPVFGQRVCAICGAREADGTDIRVCSCEKCGGQPRALCLQHARNH
jgi:membrane associated rhomboid family serine protease